jgi:hypothetical protein
MAPFSIQRRLMSYLVVLPTEFWIIWAGMTVVTVALCVLMWTRWGRSRPLRKCVALSITAHLFLLAFFATAKIVGPPGPGGRGQHVMNVVAVKPLEEPQDQRTPAKSMPWNVAPATPIATPEASELQRPEVETRPPPRQPAAPLAAARTDPVGPQAVAVSATMPAVESLSGAPAESPAEMQDRAPAPQPAKQKPIAVTPDASLPREAAPPLPVHPTSPRPQAPKMVSITKSPSAAQSAHAPQPQGQLPGDDGAAPASLEPAAIQEINGGGGRSLGDPLQPSSARTSTSMAQGTLAQRSADGAAAPSSVGGLSIPSSIERAQRQHTSPATYQLRGRPDREQVLQEKGGSPDTEAAVKAALAWLAANQERDGRWNAAKHGATVQRERSGNDTMGVSMRPDAGVTALALLAFLGAGHTHEDGQYCQTVRLGIEYLISIQAQDGNLYGPATMPAAMYCHGMATLALAEAYGMTGDKQLAEPLRRAVDYTLSAQHPVFGGWRYRSNRDWMHDPGQEGTDRVLLGDTSQLGWQLMALKAAELAGLEIPVASRHGMLQFLESVSSGRHGGLASYRVGSSVSHVMTAEAVYCRLLLGTASDNPLCEEAGQMILANLPGQEAKPNFYYWYYGTLAAFRLQGRYWPQWNRAVQKQLLSLQESDGSWAPDGVWGGHGGRVFSTALGALCLEVYYRYLPTATAARPGGIGSRR